MCVNKTETQLMKDIKNEFPLFWKHFYEYLRSNYEFWDNNGTSENTLWFCSRDYRTQYGYFVEFFKNVLIKTSHSSIMKSFYFSNCVTYVNNLEAEIYIIAKTLNKHYEDIQR